MGPTKTCKNSLSQKPGNKPTAAHDCQSVLDRMGMAFGVRGYPTQNSGNLGIREQDMCRRAEI